MHEVKQAEIRTERRPLFELGTVYVSEAAHEYLGQERGFVVASLLDRHVSGDWGLSNLCEAERGTNLKVLLGECDHWIRGAYEVGAQPIYVVTYCEPRFGRRTHVMLASEY